MEDSCHLANVRIHNIVVAIIKIGALAKFITYEVGKQCYFFHCLLHLYMQCCWRLVYH